MHPRPGCICCVCWWRESANEDMRVIITGGTGFIGQLVARDIARRGALQTHQAAGVEGETKVTEIVLADVARPEKLMISAQRTM